MAPTAVPATMRGAGDPVPGDGVAGPLAGSDGEIAIEGIAPGWVCGRDDEQAVAVRAATIRRLATLRNSSTLRLSYRTSYMGVGTGRQG